MFRYITILFLISFSAANVFEQKKILIVNHLPNNVYINAPEKKNITVAYPSIINSKDQGVISVDIQKDWLLDNPLDVKYKQIIKYKDVSIILFLKRKTPSPDFTQPFQPGYDCEIDYSDAESKINVLEFGKRGNYCEGIILYIKNKNY